MEWHGHVCCVRMYVYIYIYMYVYIYIHFLIPIITYYMYTIVRIAYVGNGFFLHSASPKKILLQPQGSRGDSRDLSGDLLQLSCETPLPPGCCLYCQRTWWWPWWPWLVYDATMPPRRKNHGDGNGTDWDSFQKNLMVIPSSSSRFINLGKWNNISLPWIVRPFGDDFPY